MGQSAAAKNVHQPLTMEGMNLNPNTACTPGKPDLQLLSGRN